MKKITSDILNILYHLELISFPKDMVLSKTEFDNMFKENSIYTFNENGFIVFNSLKESLIKDEIRTLWKTKFFSKYETEKSFLDKYIYVDDVVSIKEHNLTEMLDELNPLLKKDIILHARMDNNAWIKLLKAFNHIEYFLMYTQDIAEWYDGQKFKLMVFTRL